MEHLERLALVCLLITAMLAVIGAGTASAEQSTFCKANETPCEPGNHYPAETELALQSTGYLVFTTENAEGLQYWSFVCEEFELEGSTTTTGSSTEPVEVAFVPQFFSNCSCATVTLQAGNMKIDWTSGTMSGTGVAEGVQISWGCDFKGGPDCAYGGAVNEGITLTGGNPAVLSFEKAQLAKISGGIFCPAFGRLSVEFDVVSPTPLYVSDA
ncbi:MAG TPA: hypothetical protein VIL21_05740 [Solirubrobacterales bacterium]|jgi:hypothetical protein